MPLQHHEKFIVCPAAAVAEYLVTTLPTVQHVGIAAALNYIIASAAIHKVLSVALCMRRIKVADFDNSISAYGVIAIAAIHDIGTAHAVQVVIAYSAADAVVASTGNNMVVAIARIDGAGVGPGARIQRAVPDNEVRGILVHTPGSTATQHGLAGRGLPEIIGSQLLQGAAEPSGAKDEIVAGATAQIVVAATTGNQVIPLVAKQCIVPGTTIHRVVA